MMTIYVTTPTADDWPGVRDERETNRHTQAHKQMNRPIDRHAYITLQPGKYKQTASQTKNDKK